MAAVCGNSDRGPRCHVSVVPRARRRSYGPRCELQTVSCTPCLCSCSRRLAKAARVERSAFHGNRASGREQTEFSHPVQQTMTVAATSASFGMVHRAVCQALLHVGNASQSEALPAHLPCGGTARQPAAAYQDKHRADGGGRQVKARLGRVRSSRLQANDLQGRFLRRGKGR